MSTWLWLSNITGKKLEPFKRGKRGALDEFKTKGLGKTNSNQVFQVPRTQKDKNSNGKGGSVTVQYCAQVATGPRADHRKREEGRERLGL